MRKILFAVILFVVAIKSNAQDDRTDNLLNNYTFLVGRTGTPGDIGVVSLEICKSNKISYVFSISGEWSKYNQLNYGSYSLAGGIVYYIAGGNLSKPHSEYYGHPEKRINLSEGFNLLGSLENESTIYKSYKTVDRLNYGVSLRTTLEYVHNSTIGLVGAFEQRFYAKESLGKYNYFVSIGIRVHFGDQSPTE